MPGQAPQVGTGSTREHAPQLSLIVSTIGNVIALQRLLESLDACEMIEQVEMVLVDQTPDRAAHRLVEQHAPRWPTKLVTSARGLSVGRNVGLSVASGVYVAFPDDDCEYRSDTITRALAVLHSKMELDGVAGQQITAEGGPSALRWAREPQQVTASNYYRTTISSTLFLRRKAVLDAGGFDEQMGVGAAGPWQAGEESDLVLKMLALGSEIVYEPALTVRHKDTRTHLTEGHVEKSRGYGRGQGHLWRKHKLGGLRQRLLLGRKLGKGVMAFVVGQRVLAKANFAFVGGVLRGYRQGALPTVGGRAAPVDELKRSYLLRFMTAGLGLLGTFSVTVLVVRVLPPREASTYFGVLAALFLGPMIGRLGLGQSAIRELSDDHHEHRGSRVASRSIWATAGLSVVTAPFVAWLATVGLAGRPERGAVVGLVALMIVLEAIRLTVSDVFSGLGQVRWSVATTHHVRSAAVVTLFAAFLLIDDRPSLVTLLVLHSLVALTLLVAGLWRLSTYTRLGAPQGLAALLTSARVGVVLSAVDLASFLIGRGDVWLASFAFSPLDATRYSTASVLAYQITVPVGLASIALAPSIARLWKRQELLLLRRLLDAVATLSAAVTGLIVLVLWLTAGPLLALLYGEQLRPAALFLDLLATGSLAIAALGASPVLLIMTGHARPAAVAALVSALLAVAAGFGAVTVGGPLALAVVSALASPALFVGQWLCARRYLGFAPTPSLNIARALAELRSSPANVPAAQQQAA